MSQIDDLESVVAAAHDAVRANGVAVQSAVLKLHATVEELLKAHATNNSAAIAVLIQQIKQDTDVLQGNSAKLFAEAPVPEAGSVDAQTTSAAQTQSTAPDDGTASAAGTTSAAT